MKRDIKETPDQASCILQHDKEEHKGTYLVRSKEEHSNKRNIVSNKLTSCKQVNIVSKLTFYSMT